MTHYKYDRLSAQDNDFLRWEKPNLPMHGCATQIFETGNLATKEGGIDFETIQRGMEGILHRIPRYRQKLAWIPGTDRAVWVDDAHFSLKYHMRHTALPRPGNDEQLKHLVERVLERPLDRERPLWEIWVVEGLAGGRFATIGKTHHCMVDGASGVDVAQNLFSTTREYSIPKAQRFVPRPRPSDAELRRDDWLRWASLPGRAVDGFTRFVRDTESVADEVGARMRALGQLARYKFVPASDTPLNGSVGPHRRIDWFAMSLDEIKAVRRARGCSVNDVVLATVAGAVRDFLIERQVRPDGLEFRVAAPVNVRSGRHRDRIGNQVSTWIVPLPLHLADPLAQLAEIHRVTQEFKGSHQATAVKMVEAVHEWLPIDIQSLSAGTQNIIVTNVPGPQFPLYLLGAELRELYVHAPLIENLGMVVGLISYNGRVFWGFNADYDLVPDLADFVALVKRSFARLADAAGVRTAAASPVEVRGKPQPSKEPHRRKPSREKPVRESADAGNGKDGAAASGGATP